MKILPSSRTLLLVIPFLLVTSCHPVDKEKYFEEGVSKLLATYRNATIKDVTYNLSFSIPEGKEAPVTGEAVIDFSLTSKREPVVIDFRVPQEYINSLLVNGKTIDPSFINGHIVVAEKYLTKRYNRIELSFRAGDLSLNRSEDFLYTLFVPDRASTAFPCFDQPDIKALFSLTLEMPTGYRAMSNSPAVSNDTTDSKITIQFSETKPISTYLFAFAAGKFDLVEKEIDGVVMLMLHRETRLGYIENNADEIFKLHYNSLKWLEDYTQAAYPFDKFGFVLIPSFQYNGMEHPGAIYYRASSLLLDESPTLDERLSRASLIAHETSHIWFGDLVTMKWFDDVWLKEVFAGYMSDKIVSPDFPDLDHELRFLLSRFPAAYDVDRTRGTNPVVQDLDNMKNAGSLYGDIIYNKAPVVMRQLEILAGEADLRKGLQMYLKEYSWGNARWDDLISILENVTRKPLGEWSRMWIREAGMPVLKPVVARLQNGYKITVMEDDPAGTIRHWPQTLNVMVITRTDTVTGEVIPADNKSFIMTDQEPLCIIPDISGRAYGTFIFDSITVDHLTLNINEFADPLIRGVLWINMYENLVNGKIAPATFYRTIFTALESENDFQLQNFLAERFSSVFWDFLSSAERDSVAADAETMLWRKALHTSDPAVQRTWFDLYRNLAITEDGMTNLRKTWESTLLPGGLELSEDELCTLTLTLAVKGYSDSEKIIAGQRGRITSNDRLLRFEFVVPSVSSDQTVRDAFFSSLSDPVNREHEPWVIEALEYLHHPMVAQRSEKYILPSLEMLEEIKSTGDIFFPGNWITTTLAGHHSAEAKETVGMFLNDHPDYPADLKLKILQAADHLFRQKAGGNRQ
jgi:aminopeptidase N